MSQRVLIVPDKFKGSLTAQQAARAIAAGWSEERPADKIELLPMADGGDGFGEVIGRLLGATPHVCATVDAAGRARNAEWWLNADSGVGVFETAQVNGLSLLPEGVYHPFQLDCFGIGAVLLAAARAGARDLYLGLGGSATNDGGFGLARALGWTFWGNTGEQILTWTGLEGLSALTAPQQPLQFRSLTLAVDVDNPLLGTNGASQVYGQQKGLKTDLDRAKAEACLTRLAGVVAAVSGKDLSAEAGAGAAGGLGFGLRAFAAGSYQSGAELFQRLVQLEQRIQACDLVITAEGKLDAQSLMGKGVGVVAQAAARAGKPCLCLAGSVLDTPAASRVFGAQFQAWGIVPDSATLEESMAQPHVCLRRLAAHVAKLAIVKEAH